MGYPDHRALHAAVRRLNVMGHFYFQCILSNCTTWHRLAQVVEGQGYILRHKQEWDACSNHIIS